MIDASLVFAASAAGFIYVVTPGPAFLALLGIGADQGRSAGAAFIGGHLVGDTVWSTMALVAIVGAKSVGSLAFDVLGLVCGAYLFWLGAKAITAKRRADGALTTAVERPLVRGLMFGLTNPKGYPVAVATFTALLASSAASLDWAAVPPLVAASVAGCLLADILLVAMIGAPVVRRIYRRYDIWITRASGVMFIGFALHALATSATGLLGRRA